MRTMDAPVKTSKRRGREGKYAIVVILVLLALFAFKMWNRETIPAGLGQQTLSDGTVLVLRAVLFDKDSEYAVPSTDFRIESLWRPQLDNVLGKSRTPCIRFAFSRHDAKTGAYLGFENISHIEFSDRWGSSIRTWAMSTNCTEWIGNSSRGKTHTGAVLGEIELGAGHRFLTLSGHRPELDGKMLIKAIGWAGNTVAEFDVAAPQSSPNAGRHPGRTRTQQRTDDVVFELKHLEVDWDERSGLSNRRLRTGRIRPALSITADGRDVSSDWFATGWYYSDPTGNLAPSSFGLGYRGESWLPNKLPTWKLESDFFRKHDAKFRKEELAEVATIPIGVAVKQPTLLEWRITGCWLIPPRAGAITIANQLFDGGKDDSTGHFIAGGTASEPGLLVGRSSGETGGPGQWARNAGATTRRRDGSSRELAMVQCTWSKGQSTTTFSSQSNEHLLFLTTDLTESDRIVLVVHDQLGRQVKTTPVGHMFQHMPIYAVNLLPGAESLDVKAVFQTPISVEFEFPSPLADIDIALSEFWGKLELKEKKWQLVPEPDQQSNGR